MVKVFEVTADINVKGKPKTAKVKILASNKLFAIKRFIRGFKEIYTTDSINENSVIAEESNDDEVTITRAEMIDYMATIESISGKDAKEETTSVIDGVEIKFLNDRLQILLKHIASGSLMEITMQLEGFYLVTRIRISKENQYKGYDETMLKSLKEFAEKNRLPVIISNPGKYNYLSWEILRNTASNAGFKHRNNNKIGMVYTGILLPIDLTQQELQDRIYNINEVIHPELQ